MKKVVLIILSFCLLASGTVLAKIDNCLECHKVMDSADGPSHTITPGVHFQKGLGCADCHGGDATLEDMDDVRQLESYRGVPKHNDVPDFCARCHSDPKYMNGFDPSLPTDQLDKYKTSQHGKLVYEKQDSKVANCISCHGVHGILDAKTPTSPIHPFNIPKTCGQCHANSNYMSDYDIPTNQLMEFKESVHGHALLKKHDSGAPACNDCHGNHGATPPGVTSLAAVCGNCHTMEMTYFNESPHKEAYAEHGIAMCGFCHGDHKILKPHDDMVGVGKDALCVQCHSMTDGTRGIPTAEAIHKGLKDLVWANAEAKEFIKLAYGHGMYTDEHEDTLKEAQEMLTKSRSLVHTFDLKKVTQESAQGIDKANQAKMGALGLLEEVKKRRSWYVFASVFILLLIILLYFKIRQIEKK
jgi:hypothetical protein